MSVGWLRKTSRAAEQIAVISLFLRQTDLLILLLYPVSRRRWIMSSMSNVRGCPSGPTAPGAADAPALPFEAELRACPPEDDEDEGRTDDMAAARPDDGCGSGLARMVWVVGMSGLTDDAAVDVEGEKRESETDDEDADEARPAPLPLPLPLPPSDEAEPALLRLEETDPGLKADPPLRPVCAPPAVPSPGAGRLPLCCCCEGGRAWSRMPSPPPLPCA